MAISAELIAMADAAARAAGVPVHLFRGLIDRESSWNPAARSSAGAVGLAQVMPWWATTAAGRALTGLESPADLMDPWKNLTAGARILASELRNFGGSVPLALMAYNAGSPVVLRAIAAAGSRDPELVDRKLPRSETRAYWRAVLAWSASWSGTITRTQAAVQAKTGQVAAEVLDFARTSGGRSTGFLLLALAMASVLVLRGR